MRLGLALVIASFFTQYALADSASVTNVRIGEVNGKARFVLVTDNKRKWRTEIENNQLVLRASNTTSNLSKKSHLLHSPHLGNMTVEQNGEDLEIKIDLLHPLNIAAARSFPFNDKDKARWVVDLAPVDQADKNKSASIAKQDSSGAKSTGSRNSDIKSADAKTSKDTKKSEKHSSDSDQKSSSTDQPYYLKAKLKPVNSSISANNLISDSKPLEVVVALGGEKKAAPKILPFKGTKPMIIAIDAGHGGKDVGAIGITGQLEKHLTLAIAKELKRQIDELPGLSAVLVRDRDVFIPLTERPRIARMLGADVFVSLHADSYHDSHIAGASFYVVSHNGASSRLAQFVATHSNNDHMPDQMDAWSESLATTIGHIALESSMSDSRKMASSMIGSMRRSHIPLQYGKVQSANFMVLKNIDMPSVLVETGFISNPEQNKLLHTPEYQKKLVASLAKGLVQFAQVQPEPGIVYATLNAVKGDSMSSIAARHGISVDYLARANGLPFNERLKVGQKLKVPVNLTRRSALITESRG